MDEITVQVQTLSHHQGLPLPAYATPLSSGMDLHAAVEEPVWVPPGRWALIPTGLRLALPAGVEGQVRPRSGLAMEHGVTILNGPGTIDADYRGEVKVVLVNHGQEPFVVRRGDRIAQLVLCPVARASLRVVDSLDSTVRGAGGYGSTGA